jgi:rSAM/selenodomain-associated transferase 1
MVRRLTVSTHIVVFGREPVPGRVKTRLAREIGAESAARVYAATLEHTLAEARATGMPVALALADSPTGAWAPPADIAVEPQGGGDLGERMRRAFERHFAADAEVVVLIGSDSPLVVATDVLSAGLAARQARVVLGPATDGGYWLVAQAAPGVDLFSGIPWSVPETLMATRERLAALGVEHVELTERPDIDTAEDLRRVLAGGTLAPALARRLHRWAASGTA